VSKTACRDVGFYALRFSGAHGFGHGSRWLRCLPLAPWRHGQPSLAAGDFSSSLPTPFSAGRLPGPLPFEAPAPWLGCGAAVQADALRSWTGRHTRGPCGLGRQRMPGGRSARGRPGLGGQGGLRCCWAMFPLPQPGWRKPTRACPFALDGNLRAGDTFYAPMGRLRFPGPWAERLPGICTGPGV